MSAQFPRNLREGCLWGALALLCLGLVWAALLLGGWWTI